MEVGEKGGKGRERTRAMLEGADADEYGALLCVANFGTNTGYAWDFIENLYASLADDLARAGIRTWVAYPRINAPPASLAESEAQPLELTVDLKSPVRLWQLFRAIRRYNIRGIYLTDRPSWHPAYAFLRMAGVRFLVVHDHTSGERAKPRGLNALVKRLTRRFRPALADVVLAVSEYVRRRKLEVDLVPAGRVQVMLNSVIIPVVTDRKSLREQYGIAADRAVVVCACRAAEYKGVQYLLRAFDLACERLDPPPRLIYFGNGPYLPELEGIRRSLKSAEAITIAGYQPNIADLLGGADLCVVPSVWGEAFGLAALEPSARGVAVVASRVGGLPEVVIDDETGRLVPPGDPEALADAIIELLLDGKRRQSMGERGRQRAARLFSREQQIIELSKLFRRGFGIPDVRVKSNVEMFAVQTGSGVQSP